MELFDKLGKIAKTAADKTSDIVEITKLNNKISSLNASITSLKTKIGDLYFTKFETGEQADPELSELVGEIRANLNSIQDLQNEIQAIKDRETAKIQAEAELEAAAKAAVASKILKCPNCGAENQPGANFCHGCGTKIC